MIYFKDLRHGTRSFHINSYYLLTVLLLENLEFVFKYFLQQKHTDNHTTKISFDQKCNWYFMHLFCNWHQFNYSRKMIITWKNKNRTNCKSKFFSEIFKIKRIRILISKFFTYKQAWSKSNKTGLQPVSRPVEQILGFHSKGLSAKRCLKNVLRCGTFGPAKPVFYYKIGGWNWRLKLKRKGLST